METINFIKWMWSKIPFLGKLFVWSVGIPFPIIFLSPLLYFVIFASSSMLFAGLYCINIIFSDLWKAYNKEKDKCVDILKGK